MKQDRKRQAFLEVKEQINENLEILHIRISDYTDQGMMDEDFALYNQIASLLEELDDCHSFEELVEIVIKGKQIEHDIDSWFAMHGGTTIELTWPEKIIKHFLES